MNIMTNGLQADQWKSSKDSARVLINHDRL